MDIMNSVNIPATGDNAAEKARQLQRQGAAATGLSVTNSDNRQRRFPRISRSVFIGMMLKAMHDTVGQSVAEILNAVDRATEEEVLSNRRLCPDGRDIRSFRKGMINDFWWISKKR